MKRLLIYLLSAFPLFVFAQEPDPRLFDYSKVDSVILSMKKNQFQIIDQLSTFINSRFSTEHERLRAIFRWVADNIEYNYAYLNAKAGLVFKERKAVCNGYSELINILCNNSKIPCRKISGLAKNDVDFTDNEKCRHAWNIVKLYGINYFVEATWAAGGFDKEYMKFKKEFRNEYFLTKPEVFILQHFPDSTDDQLLNDKVSKYFFMSSPIFMIGAIKNELVSFSPQTSSIKTKYKFGFEFALAALKNIDRIGIEFSLKGTSSGMTEPIEFEKTKEGYSFFYPFERYGHYYAIIAVNGEDAIIYKMAVE